MKGKKQFIFFGLLALSIPVIAQKKALDFFISSGLRQNTLLLQNTNLQQNFELQRELINAQNKKPQVSFTADYLFAPFFFDNGQPISITSNPSPKAYGYDASITNGGLYAAQLNAAVPLFNAATLKNLYAENKAAADVSTLSRKQTEYDATKAIIDQYIVTYQFQQQEGYLQKIIDRLAERKPLVEALVKKGLLQQNDYLLLDIQLLNAVNDLRQMQFSYNSGLGLLKNLSLISDTSNYVLDKPMLTLNPDPEELYYLQRFKLDSLNLIAQQNVFNNKYRPQVTVTGTTGINAVELARIPHNIGVSAAVHLAIPISDGHQRKLNDRSVAIQLTNQQIDRDNTALLRKNNLRNARQQIEQWQQTIAMDEEPIRKQELLLDIIKEKVVKGQVTVMDYINALQDYAVMQKTRAIAESSLLLYINQYNYYNH